MDSHLRHSLYCLQDKTILDSAVLENHPVVLDFVQQQELMQQLQFRSTIMFSSLGTLLATHGKILAVSRPTIYYSLEKTRHKLWTKTIDLYLMLLYVF
jgi:hypothetical protein